MSVIIFLTMMLLVLNNSHALQCYKCSMTKSSHNPNETVRLCANFDYSSRYIVDCPYSTVCMKKDISVNLPRAINITERDCAQQRYDYQDFEDGRWQLKVAIEEPYAEGCSVIDDKGLRSSRVQYCYCRGDLCNTSSFLHPPIPSLLALIVLCILCIYNKL